MCFVLIYNEENGWKIILLKITNLEIQIQNNKFIMCLSIKFLVYIKPFF